MPTKKSTSQPAPRTRAEQEREWGARRDYAKRVFRAARGVVGMPATQTPLASGSRNELETSMRRLIVYLSLRPAPDQTPPEQTSARQIAYATGLTRGAVLAALEKMHPWGHPRRGAPTLDRARSLLEQWLAYLSQEGERPPRLADDEVCRAYDEALIEPKRWGGRPPKDD